jgi:hypothetical protein
MAGIGEADVKVTVSTESEIDGYGTLTLPNFGEIEVLRLNELTTNFSVATFAGMQVPLGEQYVRSFYWLSDELGIVAQITSEAATDEPGEIFQTASRFLRLSSGTRNPMSEDLNLRITAAGGLVTLSWDEVEGADAYDVYASPDLADGNWEKLGTVSSSTFLEVVADERRYYKVGIDR